MEEEDIGTRYYGTTIDDPLNYGFGYGNESQNQPLSETQVNEYLDSFREEYKDEAAVTGNDYDDFLRSIGINPDTTMENWKSPSNAEIEKALQGDYNFSGLLNQYGKKAFDLFKDENGKFDLGKLAVLGGGLAAARKSGATAPTGYQGKIPKLTATSNMLTAPPVGRRPGSGGINYGGGVTYRDEAGKVISSNEKTLEELRQAAINNPFNRGATYEGQQGLGQTDLTTLLNALNPSKAPTVPTAPAPTSPTPPVGGAAPSTGGGITAIAPRPTAPTNSGETVALRQQLRDEYTKGPKTQEQLDKLLLKYPPAVMRAEFPEFGNTADYNNATREAYARTEQQTRQQNREAMRASGQEVSVANPGGDVQISSPAFPTMSAIPQWELDAARAKLSPEQAAVIDWQLAQVNPMTGQRVADDYARQGTNPYATGARAQEVADNAKNRKDLLSQYGVDTSGIAAWNDPNWRAAQQAKENVERARMDKQTADWLQIPESQRPVAGPGASTEAPSGYGNYLDKQMYTAPTTTGAITEWYNANAGRTDDRAQTDLNNFLANSGYSAKEISTALPQWGETDLQKSIELAKLSKSDGIYNDAPPPAPIAAAPIAAAPVAAAPAPAVYAPTDAEVASWGYAKGGLARDGFVLPADVVSHYGNGSSEAGLKLLAERIGATPIKGDGDGMSDSIPTKIDGVQEARVANDEAYVSPEMVAKLGNGNPERGARKLYAMMDKIRKARTGSTEQGKEIDPNKYMPGGSVQRYQTGGTTTTPAKTTPTGATGYESSLSNWAGDYVTNMLGQGAALANKPYDAYTGPLTAGASGLQNQAFNMASNLQTPGSIGQAAGTAGGIANLAANMRYTPQTTDFLGGANMSGLGVAPSYGMGMPQQQAPMNIQTRPAPMQGPGFETTMPYEESGPTTFSTRPMRIKQDPQQAPEIMYAGGSRDFDETTGTYRNDQGPIMLDGRGTAPQDDGGMAHVQWEGPGNPRWEAEQRSMQKQRPSPAGGDMFQTRPMREYGGSQYNPATGAESRDLVKLQPGDPRLESTNFQTKPFQGVMSEPFMQDGAMTGGVMQPPQAGIPGALPQAGNIAQQYMNPYLESALRPQMAEMQRAADIARMSDAARLTQAGAFGGSRQAIMESEGRRNLMGKQSDALAQGYSTAYDKAMQQFNSDQARRAQEAQFGATFGLQGLQTGIQGAQAQAQAGALQSQSDLANLRGTLEAGGVERGIESEGIAADKAQFEEARLNPYKMLQFQQSLLSGMPLSAQSYNMPGTSNLQQFASGAGTLQGLLKSLGYKFD